MEVQFPINQLGAWKWGLCATHQGMWPRSRFNTPCKSTCGGQYGPRAAALPSVALKPPGLPGSGSGQGAGPGHACFLTALQLDCALPEARTVCWYPRWLVARLGPCLQHTPCHFRPLPRGRPTSPATAVTS